ncbi:MAG: hypothetical protein SGILL_000588 [Bacillariaceae sp.]
MGKKSRKSKRNHETEQAAPLEDRFAAAETRPQFRAPKQSSTKVVLDQRFSSVLTDPRFQLQRKDKYGRRTNKKKDVIAATGELKAFYVVKNEDGDDSHDNSDASESKETHDKREAHQKANQDDKDARTSESSDEDVHGKNMEEPASRIAYLTALSRGELDLSSSSDEDDSSQSSDEDDDQADGEDPVYGTAGVLDPSFNEAEQEVEISYEPSPFLAVTNMDWENIRAVDLFSVLSSFAPPGAVKKVQVYQSDFGMEKMEKEKVHGPTGIWKKNKKKQSEGPDNAEGHNDDDDDGESLSSNGSDSDTCSGNGLQKGDQQIGSDLEDNEEGLKIQFEQNEESDFDPEKLRAYEASKLRYFFAVVEFSAPEHADLVYREVDGMEFERSSAAMDLRTIPVEEVPNVTTDRRLRDEASGIPGNYQPPEFVVSALQQTNVQCTWDQGDTERERKLTKYASAGWRDEYEHDDLKAYLASDGSSDECSSDHEEKERKNPQKGSHMRKLLGLDSDDDDSEKSNSSSEDDGSGINDSDSDASIHNESFSKEIKYIPGQKELEEKIRYKLESNKEKPKELTPWEKYQEKRKQKRKERRQAARGSKNRDGLDDSSNEDRHSETNETRRSNGTEKETDDFFMDGDTGRKFESSEAKATNQQKSREELELLLAGDHDEDQARDYDIRGIQRMEKNKGKKLKGSRKRKEAKIAADVSGTDFQVNVHDTRFNAVLDGSDGRFGIDKTDPNFKDTSAMRKILSEQTKRRKKKRKKSTTSDSAEAVVPDVNSELAGKTSGASALSSLVQRLKSRVET